MFKKNTLLKTSLNSSLLLHGDTHNEFKFTYKPSKWSLSSGINTVFGMYKCLLVVGPSGITITSRNKKIILGEMLYKDIVRWRVDKIDLRILFTFVDGSKLCFKSVNYDELHRMLDYLNDQIADVCVQNGMVTNFKEGLDLIKKATYPPPRM
jgi:hypothetical protein